MIGGLTTFTLLHVVASLVGILAGCVVAGGLVAGRRLDGWTGLFLVTTIATSVSGFGFPVVAFLPSRAVGVLSLFVLLVQLLRRLPALIVAAPEQQEPTFLATQPPVLALSVCLWRAAANGFRA